MGYDNTNTGALFTNSNRANDRQPHFRGSINIEGVEYWLSAWKKQARSGATYLSIAVSPKDENAKPKTKQEECADEFDFSKDFGSLRDTSFDEGGSKGGEEPFF